MTQQAGEKLSRRSVLLGAAAIGGAVCAGQLSQVVSAAEESKKGKEKVKTYTNADFYDKDGKFLVEKAKEAYYDMFRRFGYPISETLLKGMWTLDFGLGDFANVGMSGIFWVNRQDYGYFGHEIYLLPGQMIPEHAHFPTDKGPAKMESWQPRQGMIYTFGEGDPTPEFLTKIPASQRDIVKSKHCKALKIDELGDLNRREAWHFMVAGPEGALVSEFGTFHDMDGLRFSNPKAKL